MRGKGEWDRALRNLMSEYPDLTEQVELLIAQLWQPSTTLRDIISLVNQNGLGSILQDSSRPFNVPNEDEI